MKNVLTALAILGLATAEQLPMTSVGNGNGTSAGAIQTLNLSPGSDDGNNRKLDVIHKNHDCGFSPTWLDVFLGHDTVAYLDEFIYPTSLPNLTTFSLGSDGSFKKIATVSVMAGPVAMTTYNNKSTLALAHVNTVLSVPNFNMTARLLICVPQ
jgi:hypothetical protein